MACSMTTFRKRRLPILSICAVAHFPGVIAMLSRYSIRSKLVAVISLLLLVFGGTGMLAISNMRLIQGDVADFQSRWLPAVRLLGNLRAYTIRYGRVVRDHILESDSAKKASAEKLLADLTRDIEREGAA
ncbi:hypothetical protein GPL20_34870 [Bradyrhizobium cajani]|uniref:Chemotaxis methyl-accepting receptor HlyB-like 4HB MCP domain-containing protein n=2 Tax=Bradyrhizobium cajani TaxID=1928661 RepID=A0A844TL05_9BRAD|nr:hypothetical protein [Bradyrhizobium cajani]